MRQEKQQKKKAIDKSKGKTTGTEPENRKYPVLQFEQGSCSDCCAGSREH
jgi:hypothetical protein